jgi:SAM-dependent methyltransferase
MDDLLEQLKARPAPFSAYTAADLWTDPHIAQKMLHAHLDPTSDRASRTAVEIDSAVDWIDRSLSVNGKRLCDIGCGPGLYAERFHDRGAHVVGVDFSVSSLTHARQSAAQSNRAITYIQADYLQDPLPQDCDITTFIFCDFCVLSPAQRAPLLTKIRDALPHNGALVMDAVSNTSFYQFKEEAIVEDNLMNGFWAPGDYVGAKKSFKYDDGKITLDRYLIVEPNRRREIFNWAQYFTLATLTAELNAAGFEVEKSAGSLAGEPLTDASPTIAVIARAA